MAQQFYHLRRALATSARKEVRPSEVPEEWLKAIQDQSPRTSAWELAYIVIESNASGKIMPTVLYRLARTYAMARNDLEDEARLRLFDQKTMTMLNEVAHTLASDAEGAALGMEVVHVFLRGVLQIERASKANSLLFLLSKISLGPENTGTRKTLNQRERENHHLVTACIREGGMDVAELEQAFLQSPSLRTLFTTQFTKEDAGLVVSADESLRIRSLLGMPARTDFSSFDPITDSELDAFFEDVLCGTGQAPASPAKAAGDAEALTPVKKSPKGRRINNPLVSAVFKATKASVRKAKKVNFDAVVDLMCYETRLE